MAKQEENPSFSIYKARDEKLVLAKTGKQTTRMARFLKPRVKRSTEKVSKTLFSHNPKEWPEKIRFKDWKRPQKNWDAWIERLAGDHAFTWHRAGICDAITSSTYEVQCNKNLVLGLVEFWCSETYTFVFPRFEATVTLEDTMVLGGFSVLGSAVNSPLSQELVRIEEELMRERREILRSKAKKALQGCWMDHFIEKKGELEHVAFLSLWLSRFVFPPRVENTIETHVFPVAVHLSQGTRLELAPAVLAGLYSKLKMLKDQEFCNDVSGVFQLVQLWAFEHFPLLGLTNPRPLKPGEPRAASWHKFNPVFDLGHVRSLLMGATVASFRWRPYADDLENWRHLSYCNENEQWIDDGGSDSDDEMKSFFRCLCASELVGLDCKEKYMPHRVAMQLGMDQDQPGEFSCVEFKWANFCFYVPCRSFEPGFSLRYLNWWRKNKTSREEDAANSGAKRTLLEDKKKCKESQLAVACIASNAFDSAKVASSPKEATVFNIGDSGDDENEYFYHLLKRKKISDGPLLTALSKDGAIGNGINENVKDVKRHVFQAVREVLHGKECEETTTRSVSKARTEKAGRFLDDAIDVDGIETLEIDSD